MTKGLIRMESFGYNLFMPKDSYQLPASGNISGDIGNKHQHATVALSRRGAATAAGIGPAVMPTIDSSNWRDGENVVNSDASYKQKLRSGFIELRNSLNDNKYRGVPPFSKSISYPHTSGGDALARSCEFPTYTPFSDTPTSSNDRLTQSRSYHKKQNDRRKLYRSNSSLELDHYNNDGVKSFAKEFGSANSLDLLQTDRAKNFLSMVQSYRYKFESLEQSANSKSSENNVVSRSVLCSNPNSGAESSQNFMSNSSPLVSNTGLRPMMSTDGNTVSTILPDVLHSPKPEIRSLKSKERKTGSGANESGGGFFRKLRGVKSDPSGSSGNIKSVDFDGNVRAFCHYDCQSINIKMSDIVRRRADSIGDSSRLNMTTGASAASSSSSWAIKLAPSSSSSDLNQMTGDDLDAGDGKSSDLLLSCACFHNELGGEAVRTVCLNKLTAIKKLMSKSLDKDLFMTPMCNGISVLDISSNAQGVSQKSFRSYAGHVFEYVDHGAFYYRHFFKDYDHQNFFGIDQELGPMAISIKREKLFDTEQKTSSSDKPENRRFFYQYRFIFRTSELTCLRGSILEDNIPSSSRLTSGKGLLAKDILDFILPTLNTSYLHQATSGQKISELLMKVDEQGISKTYKIGVMICRMGQSTEEEMYNNEYSSPAFDEFLNLIGTRIKLKGFESYKGGLDVKSDCTGIESIYTKLDDIEIMFHVSTLLPFTANNKQQLLRKRHIGNDIVTIIFQEPGSLPFTPKSIRSQFQHVFIVVRVHNPNSENTQYSIAVSRSKNVPQFGPLIQNGALFMKSEKFREFLLVKAINGENAVHKSDKFTAMAVRTRCEYLKDLALNYTLSSSLDSGSRLSKLGLGSGRKKDKTKFVRIPDIYSKAAVVWNVHLEDFGFSTLINCLLGIASETIVILEESTRQVLFTTTCRSVIGWTLRSESFRLYYNSGECIHLSTNAASLKEIISRLEIVTHGCQTEEKMLFRNSVGHLGFHVYHEGIVTEVEPNGPAYNCGLRVNSQLVEICSVTTATLNNDQIVELLRTSKFISVMVIPPLEDGSARSLKNKNTSVSNNALLFATNNNNSPMFQSNPSKLMMISNEEKKNREKGSINNIHSLPLDSHPLSLNDVEMMTSEGNHLQSTFHESFKGSQVSLSHKNESRATNNSPRNAAMSGSKNVSSSSSYDELTQAFLRRSSDVREKQLLQLQQQKQQQQQQQQQIPADWFTNNSPAKMFHQSSRIDFPPQQFYSQHAMMNKGPSSTPMMKQQQLQQQIPNLTVLEDSRTSSTRLKKSTAVPSKMTPSKSFQKDLIRLIDTEVPPSDLQFSEDQIDSENNKSKREDLSRNHLTHSDDNIFVASQKDHHHPASSANVEYLHQKPSASVVEIPGTIFRLQTSRSAAAIPLPLSTNSNDDWSSLVDVAVKALGGDSTDLSLNFGTFNHHSVQSSSSSSSSSSSKVLKKTNSLELCEKQQKQETLGTRTDAETNHHESARLRELEGQLENERQERSRLKVELEKLREENERVNEENVRLQEESQTSAAQLRTFTEWFFQTIEKR